MRADIERLVSEMDRKEVKLLKQREWSSPLALIDARLPQQEGVRALAFNRTIGIGGVLVVTDSRLLFVTDSVQTWKFSDINNVTSNGKDTFAIYTNLAEPKTWKATSGRVFISNLTEMVNQAKFNEI